MDYTKLSNAELHALHYDLSEIVWKEKLSLSSDEYQTCLKLQAIYRNRKSKTNQNQKNL